MTPRDPHAATKAKIRLNLVKAGAPIVRATDAVERAFAAADAALAALCAAVAAPGPRTLVLGAPDPATETLALQLAFPLIQERLFNAEASLRAGLAALPAPLPPTPEVLQ